MRARQRLGGFAALLLGARGGFLLEVVLDGPARRGAEAGQVLRRLQHVVAEAGLHGLDGHLLAARAGEHDDGAHPVAGPDPGHHVEAGRPLQVVVGDHQVVRRRRQGGRQFVGPARLDDVEVAELAPQFADHEEPVVRVVVDEQDAHHDRIIPAAD